MANNISQFYFAWVGPGETAFTGGHLREDELIFSFSIKHEEGQFAVLEMEIRNPRMGLLNTSRPIWGWFSWSDGSNVYPLFHGRLIGIPSDLLQEVVTIQLMGKPINYVDQRAGIAAGLRVLPYFDPIFIDPDLQDDPDTVLEGYSALWHVDRVSGVVSVSDMIVGEDGLDEFGPADVFYDSVKVELGEAPLVEVDVTSNVGWLQTGGGSISFGQRKLSTYTSGLNSDWPKAGQEISGGYVVLSSSATEIGSWTSDINSQFNWQNDAQKHSNGDTMSVSESWSGKVAGTSNILSAYKIYNRKVTFQVGDPRTGTAASSGVEFDTIGYRHFDYSVSLVLGMSMEQKRTETLKFKVTANLQPILTEPDEKSIVETLSFKADDVVAAAAGVSTAGAYFATARGQLSLEYMILVARAHLLAKARPVKITWECSFPRIVYSGMSCRKNAALEDARLPGGESVGKVSSYQMTGNGDTGEFLGEVTTNSAIGYGNAIIVQTGTPDYVNEGYVNEGYQHYSGKLIAADTGDITFPTLAYPGVGLQNPLSMGQAVVRMVWNDSGVTTAAERALNEAVRAAEQSLKDQAAPIPFVRNPQTIIDHAAVIGNAVAALNQSAQDNPAWLEIELKPLTGINADAEYDFDLGQLEVPMQIDLSAGSSPGL